MALTGLTRVKGSTATTSQVVLYLGTESEFLSARDKANSLGLPVNLNSHNVVITQETELPVYGLRGNGSIRGATVTLTRNQLKFQQLDGCFEADHIHMKGGHYVVWENARATNGWLLDGGSPDPQNQFGMFWCKFGISSGDIKIDCNYQSVNQNVWYKHRGGIHIYGSRTDMPDECNLNEWHSIDTTGADFTAADGSTGWAILNESRRNAVNVIKQWYSEGAGRRAIRGSFHVQHSYVDASQSPYALTPQNHVFMTDSNSFSQRNQSDYFAGAPMSNAAEGGLWDVLDADSEGQPVSFIRMGGMPATVVPDANDPTGIGFKYGGTTSSTYSGIAVNLPKTPTGRYSLFFWIQGDTPANISVTRASGGDFSAGNSVYHEAANGWKLYRLSVSGNSAGNTQVKIYANTSGAESKTMYLGAFWATPEKTAFLPSKVPDSSVKAISKGGVPKLDKLIALPDGAVVDNPTGTDGILHWTYVSGELLPARASMFPRGVNKSLTVTTDGTVLATLESTKFNGSVMAKVTITYSSPTSAPNYNGCSGVAEYLVAMACNSDTSEFRGDIQKMSEAFIWKDKAKTLTAPVVTLTQGAGWRQGAIKINKVAGTADLKVNVDVQAIGDSVLTVS